MSRRHTPSWKKAASSAARCVALASCLVLPAVIAGSGSSVATAAPQVLLGDQTIEAGNDSDTAGVAEAFRTTATTSGQVAALNVYVSSASTATKLVAGLYANSGTHPGALLAQGSLSTPAKGAWDTVALASSPSVTSGTTYWIAILSPTGSGTVAFRDVLNSGAASETSSQSTLTALASTWSTGVAFKDGPLSAYGVSGQIAPDTQPPTIPTGLQVSGITQTSVNLSWTASTDNVGVTGYDVYLDGTSKGTTPTASFGFSGLACGTTYTLSTDAFDAAGNKSGRASIQVTTSACPDTTPPTVPTGLAATTATSSSITVGWNASTDNVAVTGYGLYVGGQLTGTTTATSNTFSALSCGSTYTLGVDAYDAAGNHSTQTTISAVTAACDTTAPSVQITTPVDGSTVSRTVSVSANALDNVAVAGVQFQLDGVNLGREVTSSPYMINLDSTAVPNGSHTLTAVARDSSNNTAGSAPVTVTISNDIVPPTVSIMAPANGATVSGKSVTVTAQASDNVAVAGVQFSLDGVSLGSEVTSAPYSATWDTTAGSDGSHTLTAVARDTSNNTTTASNVTVNVANGTVDTSNTFVRVDIGPGLAEHTVRGVVRTAGNRVYVFAADDTPERLNTGPGVIRAYRANSTGNPLAFTEADVAHHPSSTGIHVLFGPDVRLDRSAVAHMVYVDQADTHLYYQTFSTVTATWGPRELLSASTPVNDGFYGIPTRVYRSFTTYNLLLDNNDVPHVVYTSGNTVYYVNKVSGTWSTPQAIYTGTSPIHEALAADASFNIYAAWLNDPGSQNQKVPQYCGTSLIYARRDAATGTWTTPEQVDKGCPNVLSGQTGDEGPSIVLDASNQPELQYLTGTINSVGSAVTTATIRRRTSSGWVDDRPPSSGYVLTHAPQIYGQGNDVYLMLGHDVNIHFGYLYQLAGQPWSAYNLLDASSIKDGSASVRWDPQRETNPHIIDVAYHDEDKRDDATWLPEIYYMAILPTRDIGGRDTVPPTVSLTTPANGATVSGNNVTVSASAADNVGVAGVQFKVDGNNVGPEVTTAPYSTTWDTTFFANGSHTLTAVARDAAGNATTSASATVTVSNQGSGSDTVPPTVSISSPANNATIVGNVTVTADASDNVGVAGVQFSLDGSNLGAEATASPWQVVWNSNSASNGSHTLTAVARDAASNRTTSAAVAVTVNNSSQILFGTQVVQPTLDNDAAGTAEAFRTAASATGTAGHVTVYVDTGSASRQLIVGIYSDSGGHPGTLLAQGSLASPVAAAWNTVVVPATPITSGGNYWVAVLGTGGTLRFRDKSGGGAAETSLQQNLTQLPPTWSTGQRYTDGILSEYGSS